MRDEHEFDEFVLAAAPRLRRTAALMLGNRHDAEDIVQDALVRVMRRWPNVRDAPYAYATQTVVNLTRDGWRRRLRRGVAVPLTDYPTGHDSMAGVDQRLSLLSAMARLPDRQRAALVLRYWEALSEHEIADALGCSPNTVKTHIARGLARLREGAEADNAMTERTPR